MGLSGLRGGRRAPGADGPDRLVRQHDLRHLFGRDPVEPVLDLPVEDGERFSRSRSSSVSPMQDDRRQPGADRRHRLAVDDRVRLAEQPPPLRVSDDRELRPASLTMSGDTSPVNAPSRSQ
jgi:hypothetical protein